MLTSVDGGGAERLPHDRFADVGGDEEGDARSESVALLEQLVEEENDEPGDEQLDDDQEAHAGADLGGVAVHAGHDVHDGLPDRDDHSEDWKIRKTKEP